MKHTNMSKNTSKDGRAERTRQSRDRIVEALLSLYSDEILVPTAQEVADRSGLGIRTVFRHFNEMEALFTAGDSYLHKKFASKAIAGPVGSLDDRCAQIVDLRVKSCARIRPYILASKAQAWKYKVLRSNYRKLCDIFKQRMFFYIPELKNESKASIDLAELMLSFETWHRLRHLQKLSQKETKDIMLTSLKAILNTP